MKKLGYNILDIVKDSGLIKLNEQVRKYVEEEKIQIVRNELSIIKQNFTEFPENRIILALVN